MPFSAVLSFTPIMLWIGIDLFSPVINFSNFLTHILIVTEHFCSLWRMTLFRDPLQMGISVECMKIFAVFSEADEAAIASADYDTLM